MKNHFIRFFARPSDAAMRRDTLCRAHWSTGKISFAGGHTGRPTNLDLSTAMAGRDLENLMH